MKRFAGSMLEVFLEREVPMKRTISFMILVAMIFIVPFPLAAQASDSSVGLGLSLGVAFPQGSTDRIPSTDWKTSFNWGFFVNIPLIYTFHLTPSSELYKLGNQNATDMALAFKFIVPLSRFNLYLGFVPGLTTVADVIAPHLGVLAGGSFNLISNLDLFVQAKYKFLFEGDQNIRALHANAGVLFNF